MTDLMHTCQTCKSQIAFGVAYCPHCGQPQEQGPSRFWSGERRLMTTVFADLASFTATSENTDPEDVIDMLNLVFSRLMIECDKEGGYLDKTVGDQLMVLFGAPRTHEDDPVRAVRAALNMQAAMVELEPIMREKVGNICKLNIGINTGVAVWGRVGPPGRAEPTVIGDAVNLACRLEQFATNGQIIVSESVYLLTYRFFEYQSLDPIRVKGKSHPIPIYVPLSPKHSVRSRQQGNEIKTPLIGREVELQTIHAHWSQTLSNRIQFVLITGAAGLGKTRLLTEFINSVESYKTDKTPLILQTRGEDTSVGQYNPLVNLLTDLFRLNPSDSDFNRRRKIEDRTRILGITDKKFLPMIGYLLGWYQGDDRLSTYGTELDTVRQSALQAAADLISKQASHRPTIVVIDDLQWADEFALQWLISLASMKQKVQFQTYDNKLLLLIVARSKVDLPIEALEIDNILNLSPLDQVGRYELIAHLLPGRNLSETLIRRISQESGGNPFYLEEAARALIESGQLVRSGESWQLTRPIQQVVIPPSIEGLVMANLDALNRSARTVIQYAAVIGLQFEFELLSTITPIDNINEIILDLERRGFVKKLPEPDDRKRYEFTQILVHEVAYRSLLRKTRRALHDRIARLTETQKVGNDQDIEKLARHFAASADNGKKLIYNWLAGQKAFERFDYSDAYYFLEIAWNSLQEVTNSNVELFTNVATTLGDVSTFTGNFEQAAACYEALHQISNTDPQKLGTLIYQIARLHLYQLNVESANHYYQQAMELLLGSPTLLTRIDAEIRILYDLG